MKRHYASIGMGDVFMEPPPLHTLPSSYSSNSREGPILAWEIVGTIKYSPQDFVVREIASRSRTPGFPESISLVADLTETGGTFVMDQLHRVSNTRQEVEKKEFPSRTTGPDLSQPMQPIDSESDELTFEPLDIVKTVLGNVMESNSSSEMHGHTAEHTLAVIQVLHDKALAEIQSTATTNPSDPDSDIDDCVWVPPISITSSFQQSDPATARSGDRGAFHRALKVAFPLLKSDTVMLPDNVAPFQGKHSLSSSTRKEDGLDIPAAAEQLSRPWIRITKDDTFVPLIPLLYDPEGDLPQLYLFRNRGCTVPRFGGPMKPREERSNDDRPPRGTKRARDSRVPSAMDCSTNDETQVILRLRPDLSRDDRRPIHHLIGKLCKDFETGTIPDYPLSIDPVEASSAKSLSLLENSSPSDSKTAAIFVRWSKHARRIVLKKQQSIDRPLRDTLKPNLNTLCVMKKTQKEHLTAIQILSTVLRCRQSDIGLAGIKDMQAVTFQFCTIRNKRAYRIRQANSQLRSRGIELGTFSEVDWVLNQGDLQGNRFEIKLRNLKRIKAELKNGQVNESLVACDRLHIEEMVNRIRRSGFINFYGEQRLGIPGNVSEVGVRSFDIGRAMLQQDFSKAVDLLMTGRLVCRGSNERESPEIQNVRRVWKESQGDAIETLKALPKGEAMARERTVLQGLKRYGIADALGALRCLHFGVRTFWINAYQSYVWNMMATERIKRFGVKVMKGDLYAKARNESDISVVGDELACIDIGQVVLPLPGYNVKYPENEIGKLYHAFMERENVQFDRDAPPEATAKGSYRSLVSFATNLNVNFGSDSCQDLDRDGTAEPTTDFVQFQFDLKSGSYATVMLRELMVTTVTRDASLSSTPNQ